MEAVTTIELSAIFFPDGAPSEDDAGRGEKEVEDEDEEDEEEEEAEPRSAPSTC